MAAGVLPLPKEKKDGTGGLLFVFVFVFVAGVERDGAGVKALNGYNVFGGGAGSIVSFGFCSFVSSSAFLAATGTVDG